MKHITRLFLLLSLVLLVINSSTTIVFGQQTGTTIRITSGARGLTGGFNPQITPDGRYVAFVSGLIYNEFNITQAYVYDRQTNTSHHISVSPTGDIADWFVYDIAISDDGQIVAFSTHATNLIANDTNGMIDVYVYDRTTNTMSRVSVDSSGNQANHQSTDVALSGNGRYVMFTSKATNLVPNDTNGYDDVFVHDRQTGITSIVSVDSLGVQGNGHSKAGDISNDGRYVVFQSDATNLVLGDTNGSTDIFAHDRQTNATTRVSVSATGTEGNALSFEPSISGDGQKIAFLSEASNLTANDFNLIEDVYVHDQQTGVITPVSVNLSGNLGGAFGDPQIYTPFISNNGRYVVFQSFTNNLVPSDTNFSFDMFVRDIQTNQTTRISRTATGDEIDGGVESFYGSGVISDDGRFAVYHSQNKNIIPNDYNDHQDIFVYDTLSNTTSSPTVGNTDLIPPMLLGKTTLSGNMSRNGRYIVFSSSATNLIPTKTWTGCEVYVYDHLTQQTVVASITDSGQIQPTGTTVPCATQVDISEDGRYVVFLSSLPFVSGDSANSADLFIRDMQLGTTTRLPIVPLGSNTAGTISSLIISADGRYVLFSTNSSTLVANDTNNALDVFMYDTQTSTTTRVSIDANGNEANGGSFRPYISPDNRYVVFSSSATNLISGGTNGQNHIFVRDLITGDVRLASVDSLGNMGNNNSGNGFISDDGRYVVFSSSATNLVPNDTNDKSDVFLHDLQTGQTSRVSVDSFGVQANNSSSPSGISSDGSLILFASSANNLIPDDYNTATDIFIHNHLTGQTARVTLSTQGVQGVAGNIPTVSSSLSADGSRVMFITSQNYLVVGDYDSMPDIFIRDLVLNNDIPDIPNLITPLDMATIDEFPIALTWDTVSGATQYRLQIASDNLFNNVLIDNYQDTTTYLLDKLTIGTYYWRVVAINPNGVSRWSAVRQFTQTANPPALQPPILIAPEDLASFEYAQMNFTWQEIQGVSSYQIQVSSTSDFSTYTINQTITTNQYEDTNFSVFTPNTYYWRVRTVVDGFYGEWSPVRQFTLLNHYPPVLTSPDDNATFEVIQVELTWQTVKNLTGSSQVQVARDADFTDIVHDFTTPFKFDKRVYSVGEYYWRVRWVLPGNSFGVWSTIRQFTVQPLPAPNLDRPSNNDEIYGVTGASTQLRWYEVPNGYNNREYYQVQVAYDDQFNDIVRDQVIDTTASLVSYSFTMEANTSYYWRVRGTHPLITTPGYWSEVRTFTILPYPAPSLVSPENDTTLNTPLVVLTWDSITSTNIQIATDDQFTQVVIDTNIPSLKTYSFNPLNNGTYYWRVRQANSEWSEVRQFHVIPFIQLLSPSDNAQLINPNITFTWESPEFTGWHYQFARYNNPNLNGSSSQTTMIPQITPTPWTTLGTYYWRVRLTNGTLFSRWSELRTFSIISATYQETQTINEQQLFNMAQSMLTNSMTFALFDITPTGIITTTQFDDGEVVTGTIRMTVQNGLLLITIDELSGGSTVQQDIFRDSMPVMMMNMLDEMLPDDYLAIEMVTMSDMGLDIGLVMPNP